MGKRVTLYVPDGLYRQVVTQLPDLNFSQVLQRGLRDELAAGQHDAGQQEEPAA